MKIKRKTLTSISLFIGFIAVLAGAWFIINHLKGIIPIFIIGFVSLVYYTWATVKEMDGNNKFIPK
jgi:hypothetical protein